MSGGFGSRPVSCDLVTSGTTTYSRQALALLVQVSIGPPLIRCWYKDTLIALFVNLIAPTFKVWPQRPLSLSVDVDLRLEYADLLVGVVVGRYAGM